MDGRHGVAALLALIAGMVMSGVSIGSDVSQEAFVAIRVDGPDGVVWDGHVHAEPATALGALLVAAEQGGFAVETTGPVGRRYVSSIAGFDDAGGGGWCFQVNRVDGDRSGDQVLLQDGGGVRWYWTDGACDRN